MNIINLMTPMGRILGTARGNPLAVALRHKLDMKVEADEKDVSPRKRKRKKMVKEEK